jgi:hypothetical protein
MGPRNVGGEGAVGVFLMFKQLVLFRLVGAGAALLLVAQGDEPIRLIPSLRLIPKLTLSIGVGTRRPVQRAACNASTNIGSRSRKRR